MSKIIYVEEAVFSNNNDNEANHSKDKTSFSEDEETEIKMIMSLLRDDNFLSKCEEFDLKFENELTSESCSE